VVVAHDLGWHSILVASDVFLSGPEYRHLVGRKPMVFAPASSEEAAELYRPSRTGPRPAKEPTLLQIVTALSVEVPGGQCLAVPHE
jgi:hypothetical protein